MQLIFKRLIFIEHTRRPSVDKQACVNVCLSTLFSPVFNNYFHDDQKHCILFTHGHSKAIEASFIT